jgi:hypothetical protein
MDVLKEQRVCFKLYQKLGKTATETYEMLQHAFEETVLSRSKTFEWYIPDLKMAEESEAKSGQMSSQC